MAFDIHLPQFRVTRAQGAQERALAYALRYSVFVQEMGAEGDGICHVSGVETDAFDPYCTHFLVWQGDVAIGTSRVMGPKGAAAAGGYYTEKEFSLEPLKARVSQIAELGRACLLPEARGSLALALLWQAVAQHCLEEGYEALVGTASFGGTDLEALWPSLSYILQQYGQSDGPKTLAPASKSLLPLDEIDRVAAVKAIPPLLKSYLRHGAHLGEGVYIDHAFNTIDVCVVFDCKSFKTAVPR